MLKIIGSILMLSSLSAGAVSPDVLSQVSTGFMADEMQIEVTLPNQKGTHYSSAHDVSIDANRVNFEVLGKNYDFAMEGCHKVKKDGESGILAVKTCVTEETSNTVLGTITNILDTGETELFGNYKIRVLGNEVQIEKQDNSKSMTSDMSIKLTK